MRYAVFSQDAKVEEVESRCKSAGAKNIKVARSVKEVFCDLTEDQANKLSKAGLKVKEVTTVKPVQILAPEAPSYVGGVNLSYLFNIFRSQFVPPLIGSGLTVAVLDTGIRPTHESLVGKVIYEEDFTDSSHTGDYVFHRTGHGTGVAYLVAGGEHGDENSGIAPGAKIMNMKCLGDEGGGTTETVVNAIDRVCELVDEAKDRGDHIYHEMYPNVMNMSLGDTDDGDPDNPVRVACRAAVREYGLQVIASAGNQGDRPGTVIMPACDPDVIAIGGILPDIFEMWEHSSRGPTKEGLIKPDFVMWGASIHTASAGADDMYRFASGTSFAAPIASGLIGLINEVGVRIYGPEYYTTWKEIEGVGMLVAGKPDHVPRDKDNAWGWGLPLLDPLVEGVIPPEMVAKHDIMDLVMVMAVMFPMVMMVRIGAGN